MMLVKQTACNKKKKEKDKRKDLAITIVVSSRSHAEKTNASLRRGFEAPSSPSFFSESSVTT
jgi:hypothetical protein